MSFCSAVSTTGMGHCYDRTFKMKKQTIACGESNSLVSKEMTAKRCNTLILSQIQNLICILALRK